MNMETSVCECVRAGQAASYYSHFSLEIHTYYSPSVFDLTLEERLNLYSRTGLSSSSPSNLVETPSQTVLG